MSDYFEHLLNVGLLFAMTQALLRVRRMGSLHTFKGVAGDGRMS